MLYPFCNFELLITRRKFISKGYKSQPIRTLKNPKRRRFLRLIPLDKIDD
jgi:hypothetical protein